MRMADLPGKVYGEPRPKFKPVTLSERANIFRVASEFKVLAALNKGLKTCPQMRNEVGISRSALNRCVRRLEVCGVIRKGKVTGKLVEWELV